MVVEVHTVGPLGCNCVILGDRERGEAMVVDPGGDWPMIRERLRVLNLRCTALVHTHTHFDHVGATAEAQEDTRAAVLMHERDLFLFEGMQMQLDAFGVPWTAPSPCEVDRFLHDGTTVSAGDIEAGVLHTPGHTPGSICLLVGTDKPTLIAGDTLFQHSIGRSDLWGGDGHQLLQSIRQRLLTLPDDTYVIAGHGPSTTVGEERRFNPFLR